MNKLYIIGGMFASLMLASVSSGQPAGQVPDWTQSRLNPGNLQPMVQIALGGGVVMDFALIPPGSFIMGSDTDKKLDERPAHQVTISKAFYLGRCEVTQEQWEMVMGRNPSHYKGPKLPVNNVSWDDSTNFVAALEQKVTGRNFNLPSEAQWEYACRAGSDTIYYYGDDKDQLGDYAYYRHVKGGPASVGTLKPNAWGLYDMHGNVWEWCLDAYHDSYEGAPSDGAAWMATEKLGTPPSLARTRTSSGQMISRTQRGGGYASLGPSVTSRHRGKEHPNVENPHYGLRVVMAAGNP